MNVFFVFPISLFFLIASASILVKFVERFASKIKLSPLVIGATLIAIGTSLPETFIAFSSLAQGVADVSMGDVVGSNIANIGLILGLSILVFPLRVGTEKTQRNNFILLATTVFFLTIFFIPENYRKFASLFLSGFYLIFLITEIIWGETGSKKEDRKAISKMEKNRGKPVLFLLGILISLIGLIVSARYLVNSALGISKILEIDEKIVGLTIVAVGTSLPELVTAIISGIKKDWKLICGNIQGSNIYNLGIIGTILIVFGDGNSLIHKPSIYFMLAVTTAIFVLTKRFSGTVIPKIYGLFFLVAYGAYMVVLYR